MAKIVSIMPKINEKKTEQMMSRAIRIRMQLEQFKLLVSPDYYSENVEYIEGRIFYLAEENGLDGQTMLDAIYARFAQAVPHTLTLVK